MLIMISYNHQGITLLPYNAPILLYDKHTWTTQTWSRSRI